MTHTDEWTAALFHYQSAMGFREEEGGEHERAAKAGIINMIQTTISLPLFPLSQSQRGYHVGVSDKGSLWPYC